MSMAKIATIINKLQDATKYGNIEWEQTEKEDVYQAAFTNFSIRLSVRPTESDTPGIDYIISIYNSSGTMIESVSDLELVGNMDKPYEVLGEIYQSAKGYALGTEQTLDSIIATLNESDMPF